MHLQYYPLCSVVEHTTITDARVLPMCAEAGDVNIFSVESTSTDHWDYKGDMTGWSDQWACALLRPTWSTPETSSLMSLGRVQWGRVKLEEPTISHWLVLHSRATPQCIGVVSSEPQQLLLAVGQGKQADSVHPSINRVVQATSERRIPVNEHSLSSLTETHVGKIARQEEESRSLFQLLLKPMNHPNKETSKEN